MNASTRELYRICIDIFKQIKLTELDTYPKAVQEAYLVGRATYAQLDMEKKGDE